MLLDFLVCSEMKLIYHLILRARFIHVFAKEQLCWGKMPAPSNFFQKTIQFSCLIDDHNPEPGTFLFPTLFYNEVLMQLMLKHMGLEQLPKSRICVSKEQDTSTGPQTSKRN